ncbi:heme anaerobic degradation radical SAM methyltransferase ChuW/HutW [Halochromatium salexigens]|uniref:Heme utilization radical SAM enzyme HutW n=1 Tax=Halochromatium salexigens TaxID=49447 RepID=A0AAJ0UJ13_HALSE|nr:heme anaerobic degradation radical SAM methyltransferase ChuW/HutW [Halochromatium salexigens]MBK5932196.1 putative heme utilization radical SAM enzyme HutW [Halochromatium salexigens]
MTPNRPIIAHRPLEAFFARESSAPLAQAFGGQRPVHPFVGLTPVDPSELTPLWEQLTETPLGHPAVAYVHVPYCANHCLFCGFYQNAWREEAGSAYVDALITQLQRERDRPDLSEAAIRAVYFGGGTPTLLSAADLARAIEAVRETLPLAADCEITVEGRVHGFGLDKARAAFAAGANRLSLGVQTFDERLRQRLGRKASRTELLSALEGLMGLDQGAIVIDLIFGLPEQDAALWAEDLDTAIALGLDGVDLYALKQMRNTPLASAVDAGKLKPAAPEQLGRFYQQGTERLDAARWEPLSSSHWRQGTRERNLYNLLVKAGADCLAIGAGAGGSLHGGERAYSFRNTADVDDYQRRLTQGEPVVTGLMRHSPHARLFNRIKGELERGHLDLVGLAAELQAHADRELASLTDPLFAQWQRAGLVMRDGRWLELTLAGRFWQVPLTQNLLEWLDQCLRETPSNA